MAAPMAGRNALLIPRSAFRQFRITQCIRCRYSSTEATPAPSAVLTKLREDLKTAMRAKDMARLSVLRMVLAEITNASKTQSPIKDDLTLLALLKKKIAASKTAISEFYENDRKDLVKKEEEQMNMLEEYAGGIKTLSAHEISEGVKSVIAGLTSDGRKLALGDVMKRALGPGGVFDGKMVEKSEVVKVIKASLEAPAA